MASVLLALVLLLPSTGAFRVVNSPTDPVIGTHAAFEPYATGTVGYYGDPTNPSAERLNEGSPYSPDTPRIFFSTPLLQSCPGMVGPGRNGEYYCFSREYGHCDRRSGLCVCNQGYTGLDCTTCQPGYYKQGGLCFAKKSCPNDCSRGGQCDYATGICTCKSTRRGTDCSQRFCSFDDKCVSCTSTACLKCVERFYVDPSTQTCVSCARFDPRCLSCNSSGCLGCADLQLNSVRRSGARRIDRPLPDDERLREFSQTFVYGSQDPRVFDEAEAFTLVPSSSSSSPLNESSTACTQGGNADAGWTCASRPESHRVCGHRGVLSFASPLHAIAEGAGNITVTVQRSGGGLGSAALLYDLEHVTTTPGDASPTAFYTSSQRLEFSPGVVSLSFKLQIHDNFVSEGDKTFRLRLREPFPPTDLFDVAPATLGNQWRTLVTILDDDAIRPVPDLTHVVNPESTLLRGGIVGDTMTFQVQSVLGSGVPGVDPASKAVLLLTSYIEEYDVSTGAAVFRKLVLGTVTPSGGVDASLYTCTWSRERAGNYSVAVQLLYPGGLRGDYFGDAWLGEVFDSTSSGSTTATPIVSRIDHQVNFTWNTGPAFPGAQSHFSIRWAGWLKPRTTGSTMIGVSVVGHARLWVDDALVIDRWGAGGETSDDFPVIRAAAGVTLNISKLHSLVLEYRAPRQGDLYVRLLHVEAKANSHDFVPMSECKYRMYNIHGPPAYHSPIA